MSGSIASRPMCLSVNIFSVSYYFYGKYDELKGPYTPWRQVSAERVSCVGGLTIPPLYKDYEILHCVLYIARFDDSVIRCWSTQSPKIHLKVKSWVLGFLLINNVHLWLRIGYRNSLCVRFCFKSRYILQ